MSETLKLRVKIYKETFIVAACICLISFFVVDDYIAFSIGVLFGSAVSVINFTLLAFTMEKAAKMTPRKAQIHASSRYFIRFLIYGAVLFLALRQDWISIVGTIVGLLLVKVVIYVTKIVIENRKKGGSK